MSREEDKDNAQHRPREVLEIPTTTTTTTRRVFSVVDDVRPVPAPPTTQRTTTPTVTNTALFDKLATFLPQISAANAALKDTRQSSSVDAACAASAVNIERGVEDDGVGASASAPGTIEMVRNETGV